MLIRNAVVIDAQTASFLLVGAKAGRLRQCAANLPPRARAALLQALDDLERCAASYRTEMPDDPDSLERISETQSSESELPCDCISTETAAQLLGFGIRRIQQLAHGGALPGHRHGRAFGLDRDGVRAYRIAKGSDQE